MTSSPPLDPSHHVSKDIFPSENAPLAEDTSRPVSPTIPLTGLEGLTLYEKKCVLINREIDAQGMGTYQWYIWGLCGFGYLLDLLWAHAFGMVLSPLQQELGFGNDQSGNISTSFNAGLTAGAFVWGFLSDVVGRRWAFNLTCAVASVFGICLGTANNYNTFLVLTAFVGFGVGGNIPIDTTITLEFLPQNKRFLLACLSVFQPIGVVISSAIAYGFIPVYSCSPNFSQDGALPSCNTVANGEECCSRASNMGWRYLLFTTGGITILVFVLRFFVFHFRESPKFLVYKGHDDKAIEVIRHMAKVNKQHCMLNTETFAELTRQHQQLSTDSRSRSPPIMESSQMLLHDKGSRSWIQKTGLDLRKYKALFDGFQMTRLTILVWFTYIFDFWGFTVAGFYLPRILALKNGAAQVGLTHTYRAYIYTYTPGILGVLLGALMYRVPSLGRKWTMCLSSGLMGTAILLLSTVDTVPKNEGLFTLEYFFQSMFNAVLYGWTPEAFPAPVRGTACGIASFWGRLFGIVSPLIAQHLYGRSSSGDGDVNAVLYLAGGMTMGCVITTALLPSKLMETKDERSK